MLCNSNFLRKFIECFHLSKEPSDSSLRRREASVAESLHPDSFIETLRRSQDNLPQFVKLITQSPKTTLSNLLTLEEEIDQNEFLNVINSINPALIESLDRQSQAQGYLYYLKLKVSIIVYNDIISIDSLLAKTYDFSVDRLISEFIHNLLNLKNLYKFVVFEDKDDRSLRLILFKRMFFFEKHVKKLFLLMVLFCCNADLCRDNRDLIQLTQKVHEFYELAKWYFLNMGSMVPNDRKREKLKAYVDLYTRDALAALKMYAFNREKVNKREQYRTLVELQRVMRALLREHPESFIKFQKELDNFESRLIGLRAQYAPVLLAPPPMRRRAISDSKLYKTLDDIKEESVEDPELDENLKELVSKADRSSIKKELSSRYDKQPSWLDADDSQLLKGSGRYKCKPRGSYLSVLIRNNTNYL